MADWKVEVAVVGLLIEHFLRCINKDTDQMGYEVG